MNFKKNYKQLYNTYKKQLGKLSASSMESCSDGLKYFVCYIAYIRDKFVLESESRDVVKDKRAIMATLALSEYDEYNACINKYFDKVGKKLSDKPDDEVLAEYNKEKQFHFAAFWNAVMLGMPLWTAEMQ